MHFIDDIQGGANTFEIVEQDDEGKNKNTNESQKMQNVE